ncbi:fumarylacetoacetase [Sphingomonas sp. BN140010]|uniref:fumarylacetoacetase n=1 Tax=Sphingomonas arvum TaxID=2992113 RepID=A0ABT3JG89_9SPHN|nr:fumarylacetoacetase [Sphingomonas sp. BN140010]MCW3798108.1 fumarylacetoacetase [Sphingomonas sp. BN140010]
MNGLDHTHDPALTSWVDSANGHRDFPIQNLPLGVFSAEGAGRRIGVAIGDFILDLTQAADLLDEEWREELALPVLNAWLARGNGDGRLLRHRLSELLSDPRYRDDVEPLLIGQSEATMHLPCLVGDYTDFYVGIHHATNVGKQFRPDQPLLPNYKYVPIGYHGRASSVRASGEPVIRPSGQRKPPEAEVPVFGPSRRLDYELELGVWIGRGNRLGEPVTVGEAGEHVAGYCLLNDWSARDLQAWEYQPLGPFLAKNFLTSISPWVVTAEALKPFRVPAMTRPEGDPQPLDYLRDSDPAPGLGLTVEALLSTAQMREAGQGAHRLSHGSAAAAMYWTVNQIVAHHTANGCNLQPGDLIGTGTLSTDSDTGLGSLLEISRGGKQPIELPTGETRSFLEDGDELILTARAEAEGAVPIGFGECRGLVVG